MDIHVLTLFPDMFVSPLAASILKRAQVSGLVSIHLHNFRDYASDKHRTVDDTACGGGPGMILKVNPLQQALAQIESETIILLTPDGEPFTHSVAATLAKKSNFVLICGRYEGVDERIREQVTHEISLGDFVLTGGELAAMAVIDATIRFIPGVLGQEIAPYQDSFHDGLLEFPQYTKPDTVAGSRVPAILLSGNHQAIAAWRREKALERTLLRRSDLFKSTSLSTQDQITLQHIIEHLASPN